MEAHHQGHSPFHSQGLRGTVTRRKLRLLLRLLREGISIAHTRESTVSTNQKLALRLDCSCFRAPRLDPPGSEYRSPTPHFRERRDRLVKRPRAHLFLFAYFIALPQATRPFIDLITWDQPEPQSHCQRLSFSLLASPGAPTA